MSPFGSLVEQSKARAWDAGETDLSSLTPPGCAVFNDTTTATSIRIDYDFTRCGWYESPTNYNTTTRGLRFYLIKDADRADRTKWKIITKSGYKGSITYTGLVSNTRYQVKVVEAWKSSDVWYVNMGAPSYTVLHSNGKFDFYAHGYVTTKPPTYTTTAVISPTGGGTVTGSSMNCPGDCVSGILQPGASYQVTAQANSGYRFDHWLTQSGNTSTTNPFTITNITQNKIYTAVFVKTYEMQVTIDTASTGRGTVTAIAKATGQNASLDCPGDCASSPMDSGSILTLQAHANTGYRFDHWMSQAGNLFYAANLDVTMIEAKSYTAYFIPEYTLTTAKTGTGSGTITASGVYGAGTSVTVVARAAAGSVFVGWTGECTGSGSCAITMNSNKSVTAQFDTSVTTQNLLTVVKAGTGTGDVSSSPSGISGTDVTQSYVDTTSVTLTARAEKGSVFAGWSGDCTGSSSACTVSMAAARNVTATFDTNAADNYVLTIEAGANGTVTTNTGGMSVSGTTATHSYPENTSVAITATPATGYNLSGWGGACSGTSTCIVAMDRARFVSAVFTKSISATPTLTVTLDGAGVGTVTSSSPGIDEDTLSATFAKGSTIVLTAHPAANSLFLGWEGDCAGTGSCTLRIDDDLSITAIFGYPEGVNIPDADTTYSNDAGSSVRFIDELPVDAPTGVKVTLDEITAGSHSAPGGHTWIKGIEVEATNVVNESITTGFSARVTMSYPDSYIGRENLLDVFYWDNTDLESSKWHWNKTGISDIVVDRDTQSVSFTVTHFSEYGLLGAPAPTSNTINGVSGALPTTLPVTGLNTIIFFLNMFLACCGFVFLLLVLPRTRFAKLIS